MAWWEQTSTGQKLISIAVLMSLCYGGVLGYIRVSPPRRTSVFISYHHADRDIALDLCDKLRASKFQTWIDVQNLRGGDTWKTALELALRRCPVTVVLITTNSTNSAYVLYESSYARALGKRVVPIVYGQAAVWPPFQDIHAVSGENLEAVLKAVAVTP